MHGWSICFLAITTTKWLAFICTSFRINSSFQILPTRVWWCRIGTLTSPVQKLDVFQNWKRFLNISENKMLLCFGIVSCLIAQLHSGFTLHTDGQTFSSRTARNNLLLSSLIAVLYARTSSLLWLTTAMTFHQLLYLRYEENFERSRFCLISPWNAGTDACISIYRQMSAEFTQNVNDYSQTGLRFRMGCRNLL